jgi:hypothetical protein
MVELDSLNNFSIYKADSSHADIVSGMILGEIFSTSEVLSSTDRSSNSVNIKIRGSISRGTCYILMINNLIIGAACTELTQIGEKQFGSISYINVLKPFRVSDGNILFNNYIMNNLFKNIDLYIKNKNIEKFIKLGTKVSDDSVLISEVTKESINKFYNKIKGL